MRRLMLVLTSATALLVAGCGGGSHHTSSTTSTTSNADKVPAKIAAACPAAAGGHGAMGVCAPKQKLGLSLPHLVNGPLYPDRSNNDPCVCGALERSRGHVGLIVKANQGVGFIDRYAVPMVQSARAAGLAVGVYDFDQDYTVSEARVFVARAQAAGIYPHTPNTFPLYLDVEFGNFNYSGLIAQIAYLHSQGYRVGIYTGQWYWSPHAGCRWPSGGVTAWLSGYPNAPVPCGTTGYNSHQFTSTPIDLSVYLGSRAQFQSFVSSAAPPKPKPDPYRFYDKSKRRLARGVTASEYNTVKTWDRRGCRNPVKRSVCQSSRAHMILLRDRLIRVSTPQCMATFGTCPPPLDLRRYHRKDRLRGMERRVGRGRH